MRPHISDTSPNHAFLNASKDEIAQAKLCNNKGLLGRNESSTEIETLIHAVPGIIGNKFIWAAFLARGKDPN